VKGWLNILKIFSNNQSEKRRFPIPNLIMYKNMMYVRDMNKSTLYKGCLEPIVMRLLKDNGRMYGYQITQLVKEITKGELQITEGALYPLLHRLEEQNIIEAEMENIGNRVRKYYTLTKAGKKQTTIAMEELRTFMQSLDFILNPKPAI
jgi:PadR family transcriptional regulator PadR